MAFQFPPGPAVDQTFTPVAGVTYRWSGTAWHLIAGPGAFITAADADTRYVNIDEAQNTTNRIINGKMAIDQRNAGSAVTSGNFLPYGLDRWAIYSNEAGRFTIERLPDAPRPGEFVLRAVVTTAQAVIASSMNMIVQYIEGYNVADLHLGSTSATPFTFAFEAYSPTVTGTFALAFRNLGGARSYVTTFSIVADTLKTVVVTVPGDTTGTWNRANGTGMEVTIALGVGSTSVAPSTNTWVAGSYFTAAGCINMMATIGSALHIGNVRLYKGSVDYGPDRRLYAEELALCQRYYEKTFSIETAPVAGTNVVTHALVGKGTTTAPAAPIANWVFAVEKRTPPTITLFNIRSSGAVGQWSNAFNVDSANANVAGVGTRMAIISNSNIMLLASEAYFIAATASAEL